MVLHSEALAGRHGNYNLADYDFGLANHLGIRYDKNKASLAAMTQGAAIAAILPSDFGMFLSSLEYLVDALPSPPYDQLDAFIAEAIDAAPGGVGVRWEGHRFYPGGAQLLDAELVSGPLAWLRRSAPAAVAPMERALDALLAGQQTPAHLRTVITAAYEALETAAKVVCGNDRDLSGNRDRLVKVATLDPLVAGILRAYIPAGNSYRHGSVQPTPDPDYRDAEAFLYTTGLLLRAISAAT